MHPFEVKGPRQSHVMVGRYNLKNQLFNWSMSLEISFKCFHQNNRTPADLLIPDCFFTTFT